MTLIFKYGANCFSEAIDYMSSASCFVSLASTQRRDVYSPYSSESHWPQTLWTETCGGSMHHQYPGRFSMWPLCHSCRSGHVFKRYIPFYKAVYWFLNLNCKPMSVCTLYWYSLNILVLVFCKHLTIKLWQLIQFKLYSDFVLKITSALGVLYIYFVCCKLHIFL